MPTKQLSIATLTGALLLALASPAIGQSAEQPSTKAQHHAASASDTTASVVPPAAQPAVDVVNAFGTALSSGNMQQVAALLDPAVIILETGGAERSRAEYLDHHAKEDARFLSTAHVSLTRRTAQVNGAMAWVASESEIHTSKDGEPITLLSAETMVLTRHAPDWRIVHIHWSSRPKKTQ